MKKNNNRVYLKEKGSLPIKNFLSRRAAVILVLTLFLIGFPALPSASAATSGDYSYTVAGGKATITRYTGGNSVVVIPGTLEGHPVTCMGDRMFYGCSALTSVTIPKSVTSIGEAAFSGCTALSRVTIPNSVTSIGASAFYNCAALTSVTIPSSVTIIGTQAFQACTRLIRVTIPNRVTSIGDSAFSGCAGLTSVTIGSGVTSLGDGVFAGCYALTSITIPNSVTSIGDMAFYACLALTSVTIPDSVISIGIEAFYWCRVLTSATIGSGVTNIGTFAFAYCVGLTSVTIGSGVTTIGDMAFSNCTKLSTVYFLGNAPTNPPNNILPGTSDMFQSCADGFTVHYISGTTGWTNPWYGYSTVADNSTAKHQPEIKGKQHNYSFPLVSIFSIFLIISLLLLSFGKNKRRRVKR